MLINLVFFRRLLYKVRPPRELNTAKVPRISADVVITANGVNGKQNSIGEVSHDAYRTAVDQLSANIKAKLSSFTQESFADFPSALPQLRTLSNQAAQAVGFYNAEFKFEKLSDSRVRVHVVPNPPVAIKQQNIEFTGEGQYEAQFQVIGVLPDQDIDDVFNHGLYEQTKNGLPMPLQITVILTVTGVCMTLKSLNLKIQPISIYVTKQASVINSVMLNFV